MSILMNYSFFGLEAFEDDSTSITSIKRTDISNSIVDELNIRERTDVSMDNVRGTWEKDYIMLGKFVNSLEAGNIGTDGVKIVKFKVLRRIAGQNQSEDIYLGEVPYTAGSDLDAEFLDSTQPNQNLVYTILSVGENGLDGSPREISVDSTDSFTGWWLVDKESGNTISFDKAIGEVGSVENTLNQDRVVLDTFNKYAQVYYGQKNYETFSLSTVILPEELERSGQSYQEILNQFILNHKPMIVKSDNGRIFVCDVSNPRTSNPLNSWRGHDYIQLTVDLMEIDSYENYMKNS